MRFLLSSLSVALAGIAAATVATVATIAPVTGSPVAAATPIDTTDDTPWFTPVTPPTCSTATIATGDVTDCIIMNYTKPSEKGFGVPPAPGVGDGWTWTGSTYSGSAALADYEADHITTSTASFGGLPANMLETHNATTDLFEGFMTEIEDAGYHVRWASAYSFRCTSGSGGWSCPSGDIDDLSYHAHGIALDMNSGANPIRSYGRVDGVTACRTPMDTDLPRWVIQTAQKWGLYWGGYGWSGGCSSLDVDRNSVTRDPPHFEFRGTPAQAATIAAFNLGHDPSRYCLDVVNSAGATVETCNRTGVPSAGWRLPVDLDPPSGSVAALVNLTAADGRSSGYLTLESCGAHAAGDRQTSNNNFEVGRNAANLALVPLDESGLVCVYRSAPAHSMIDIVGFVVDDANAGDEALWFTPIESTRLHDTRHQGRCDEAGNCTSGRVRTNSVHSIPLGHEGVGLVNLTAVDASSDGFLTAGRCGTFTDAPTYSTLNYRPDVATANLAIVDGRGDDRTCAYVGTEANVVADLVGTLSTSSGQGWRMIEPRRVIDTRGSSKVAAGTVRRVDIGNGGPGAVVNVTIVDPKANGYATIGQCDTFSSGVEPATSTVNYGTGDVVANMSFIDTTGNAEICVYTYAQADLIVDVQAELVEDHGFAMIPVASTRLHDSRAEATNR